MKKYYLHNGIESSGPFDLEELKIKQITPATPVWFSGMPDWKKAGEIAELEKILQLTPPPFKTTPPVQEIKIEQEEEQEEKKDTIMGLSKSNFYIVSFILLFAIGIFVLNILEENRSNEFQEKNEKTERENRQFQLQQTEIEQQKKQLEEQERLEAERIAQERKLTINSELSKIQIKQIENQTRLEESKNNLVKATEFQFFRTENERNEELNSIQSDIDHWKNEIQLLENKRNQLSLELERMK
ncbi:MAG TPA: GYF domain-containing protein [Flavobacterium sp.]|nr:GYF domain-containing protein [Flavobacterium sp.]